MRKILFGSFCFVKQTDLLLKIFQKLEYVVHVIAINFVAQLCLAYNFYKRLKVSSVLFQIFEMVISKLKNT